MQNGEHDHVFGLRDEEDDIRKAPYPGSTHLAERDREPERLARHSGQSRAHRP